MAKTSIAMNSKEVTFVFIHNAVAMPWEAWAQAGSCHPYPNNGGKML
jgi:hypothetical protein